MRQISKDQLRRITSIASVLVATTLVLAKVAAYFLTGSIALLSSLIDSGMDVLASLVTAFGITKALEPPDRDHRFGHAKAESLTALAQAAFITGSALFLSLEALDRFVKPFEIDRPAIGYGVMLFAIAATLGLLALQSYTVKRTGSLAIAADRMHYAGDVLINLAVMASIAAQQIWGVMWADPLFALLIAAFLFRGAKGIAIKSLSVLMDAELPEEDRKVIADGVKNVPGVLGIHDLRTRFDSDHRFIEVHVEMDGALSLNEAHKIVDNVEAAIHKNFPAAEIIVHQDPYGVEEKRLDLEIEKNDPPQ